MSLKKKLGAGVVSAALGLSLIGGGTYAYFSDQEVTNNKFAAGTLDFAMQPTTSLNLDNLKPGDKILKKFNIKNSGTLDIKDIVMKVDYTVNDFKKIMVLRILVNTLKYSFCGIGIQRKVLYMKQPWQN